MNDRMMQWMYVVPLAALLVLTFLGCAVEQREQTRAVLGNASVLPDGVYVSQNKKYLVLMTPAVLRANEDNEVTFKVVSSDFSPALKEKSVGVDTDYFMPGMEMDIPPAVPTTLDDSRVKFTYQIVHGGLWHFVLKIKNDGQPLDQVTIALDIPKSAS